MVGPCPRAVKHYSLHSQSRDQRITREETNGQEKEGKEVEEEERGGEGLKHCTGWMINEWKKFLNGRNFRNRTSAGSETTSDVTKPFLYMESGGDSEGRRPTNRPGAYLEIVYGQK